jgi:hypothetical protein
MARSILVPPLRCDFHEVAVWSIKSALRDAFEAGRRAERKG